MAKVYHPNMAAILAQDTLNYRALVRLLSDADKRHSTTWGMGTEGALHLEILEEFKYTTSIRVNIESKTTELWQPRVSMQVQMYHDAKLAEVVSVGPPGRLKAIYDYPNDAMLQPDEKAQCDRFLGECVNHCLHHKLSG